LFNSGSFEQLVSVLTDVEYLQETADVIKSYGDQIVSIQQPDQSEPDVPLKEAKFKGYFKIAR
jgi:alpha-1,3-mannosyl-glycoprotein beta-1,2-N-acetylglucosaminyltransferase